MRGLFILAGNLCILLRSNELFSKLIKAKGQLAHDWNQPTADLTETYFTNEKMKDPQSNLANHILYFEKSIVSVL